MRKLLAWFLAALMALSGFAFAEATEAPEASAQPAEAASAVYNGRDAVRVANEVYFAIPDGERQMLVRVNEAGGEPVCVDRGDQIEDLIPYAGGVAYLKTENGSSAITACNGGQVTTVYAFGAGTAGCMSYYSGRLLVLIDGMLHSVEPGTQLCLRLSGSQMLDYVLDGGVAYFLSAGDRMEYTAQLDGGEEVSAQAGCVYSLDLNSGETNLLLKKGVQDLQIGDGKLYFHHLEDAYVVRLGDQKQLKGRVHGLDLVQHTTSSECTEADNGFWATDRGPVIWYGGALNYRSEAGDLALYSPESGATVASDGQELYVWESGKQAVTRVELNGAATQIYAGDLTQAQDLSLMVPEISPEPEGSPEPTAGEDADDEDDSGWFEEYMNNTGSSSGSGSSGSSGWPGATPIGVTPTPRPTNTPAPTSGTGNSSSGSGSSGSGSGSSGSGSSGSSGGTYSVNISKLDIIGDVNVRSGPSKNYSVKTTISKGAVVSCTGKAAKDSRGVVWYRITHNGVTGWVSSAFARKSGSGSSSSGSGSSGVTSASGTRYTTGAVNMRTGPGLNYSSKGAIGKGAQIKITAKATDSRGVTWYKTKYNGVTGWVSARYLSKTKPGTDGGSGSSSGKVVTTGSVTIRSKANKSSKALGTIPSGKRVDYMGSTKKDGRGVRWFKINYKGIIGWISSKYSYRD